MHGALGDVRASLLFALDALPRSRAAADRRDLLDRGTGAAMALSRRSEQGGEPGRAEAYRAVARALAACAPTSVDGAVAARLRAAVRAADAPDAAERVARLLAGTYPA